MLINWALAQPFAWRARSSLVYIRAMQRRAYLDDHANGNKKKPVHYLPWNVLFFFVYKNHLFRF